MPSKSIKQDLRHLYLEKRGQLSIERRQQASTLSYPILKQWIEDHSPSKEAPILSFAPFKDEIDIWELNRWILREKILLLPKVEGGILGIYQVKSLNELTPSKWGILEPQGKLIPFDFKRIEVVLVPGLAFDNKMHRLGYGKGYYDGLLASLSPKAPKVGIGFKEQLSSEPLPSEGHDILLTHRFLF